MYSSMYTYSSLWCIGYCRFRCLPAHHVRTVVLPMAAVFGRRCCLVHKKSLPPIRGLPIGSSGRCINPKGRSRSLPNKSLLSRKKRFNVYRGQRIKLQLVDMLTWMGVLAWTTVMWLRCRCWCLLWDDFERRRVAMINTIKSWRVLEYLRIGRFIVMLGDIEIIAMIMFAHQQTPEIIATTKIMLRNNGFDTFYEVTT